MYGQKLLQLIVPSACRGCYKPGPVVCLSCLRTAVVARAPSCHACYWGTSRGQSCLGCTARSPLAGTTVVSAYEGLLRELILTLKDRLDQPVGQALGALLARRLMVARCGVDVITAIPSSPGRYRERGHNPAELIARAVATSLNVPYVPLLGRLRTSHQIGQDRARRFHQVNGVFYIPRPRYVRGKHIIIVDDVLTTGATLGEAATTLLAHGSGPVWGAAIARR